MTMERLRRLIKCRVRKNSYVIYSSGSCYDMIDRNLARGCFNKRVKYVFEH